MAKRNSLLAGLEEAAQDSTVKAVAASAALAAGGVITARTAVRNRVASRRRREARRYRLAPDETAADGLRRVARGQLELATELVRDDHGKDRAEAVHETRKALKRLRALIRLSRDALGTDLYRSENVAFRDLGRSLSGARDTDVLIQTLDGIAERFADELPPGAWTRFRHALQTEREAAPVEGPAQTAAGALTEAEPRVARWPLPEQAGIAALAPGFERIYRRGRRARRLAKAQPSDENLHELRKRAKDLWHAAQLTRPVCPKRMKRLGRRAHRLSDLLGDDHDLTVLVARADSQPELFGEGELELLHALVERRRIPLIRKSLRCARKVYRRKPGKLVRKLSLA